MSSEARPRTVRWPIRAAMLAVLLLVVSADSAPALGVDSFFDVFTEADSSAGPPYPSDPPVRIGAYGQGKHLEDIILRVGSQTDAQDVLMIDAIDSGGGAGGDAGDSATLAISLPEGNFNVDSFFDIVYRIDFSAPDAAIKSVSLPDSQFVVDSFFDISYQIEFDGGGTQTRTIRGTFTPGQNSVTKIDGAITPSASFVADSFFDITYQIEFNPGIHESDKPLLYVGLIGGYTPEPGTIALLGLGGAGLLATWRRRRRS